MKSLRRTLVGIFALTLCASSAAYADWKPLFDGKSLEGWQGKSELWSVKDGAIVGSTKPGGIKSNTFLVSDKEYENFVLRLKFKFDGTGNSGIQFRSSKVGKPEDFVIKGYQADIGSGYYGSLYDEKRRGMLQAARRNWVKKFVRLDGKWNRYEISVIGNQITQTINGLVTARYTEKDDKIARKGFFALQLHAGPPMEISFKDIQIDEILPKKLLFVTKSAGFRHGSIPTAHKVLTKVGIDSGYFEVTATNDTDQISPEGLAKYDALFFYTTGDLKKFPLSEANRDYMIQWVKDGHAFGGFHSATDTFKDWQPYWDMIGGSFDGHPWHEEIIVDIEDPTHPSVTHIDTQWKIKDEIYQFKNYSRDRLHIIASMNPASVKGRGKRKDGDYAIAWCRQFGKGKVFYTSLGHRDDVWNNPVYQKHIEGGVLYALGIKGYEADETPGLPKSPAKFESLLGDSLAGWTKHKKAEWTLKDGVLSGRGPQGHIFSPKQYVNFHYKADIRIGDDSNSGMYFRAQLSDDLQKQPNWPHGMEAQVNSAHGDPVRTGSLYEYVKVFEQLIPVGEWGTQEVICRGEFIVIKVNGKVTVRGQFPYNHKKHFPKGHFAFQQHHSGSEVDIKNVMVRELPSKAK
jgi:type 1 glutamine amidotransferase